jgi:hypothetical protein
LVCINSEGQEMDHITPLDLKLNKVKPIFECQKLQELRKQGNAMSVEYSIINGIGKSWLNEIQY